MRILKLTPGLEASLLKKREQHDAQSHKKAAEIIADVRKRGAFCDAASEKG